MSQKKAVILAFSVFVILFVVGISMRIYLPKKGKGSTEKSHINLSPSFDSITHAD